MTLKKYDKLITAIDRAIKQDLADYDDVLAELLKLRAENKILQGKLDRVGLSPVKNKLKVRVQELEIHNNDLLKENRRLEAENQKYMNAEIERLYNYDPKNP